MVIKETIQAKIRLLIISFTIAISVFFIGLLIVYSWVIEDNIFNRIVAEEARYIEQRFAETGQQVKPRIPFMSLYSDWEKLPETIQMLRQQSPDRIEFPLSDGGTMHIRELQLGDTRRLLAANVSSYEISKIYLPKLIPWILFVLVAVGFFAFMLAHYLARSVVKPLQHITTAVASNQDSKPLAFDREFSKNEIGYLAHTISKSFNRLHAALRREADFSRDISHELRTPVAILKLVSGRINSERPLDTQSISRFISAINDIEQSLVVLLALSREESVESETLSLLKEVEHCVINHFGLSKKADAELEINIPQSFIIQCNKNLLHIMLNNLLDNAVNHASKVDLHISLDGHTLTLINPVEETLPHDDFFAPQVKTPNSEGLGQGLHLVKRICDKYGWNVCVNVKNSEFTLLITMK